MSNWIQAVIVVAIGAFIYMIYRSEKEQRSGLLAGLDDNPFKDEANANAQSIEDSINETNSAITDSGAYAIASDPYGQNVTETDRSKFQYD